ncbi:MAG: hypothetical protein OXD44_02815 [Gammaproteobacteria bacterium]|nr:hypothetical protein [Gammaproteobacteria bacterium]
MTQYPPPLSAATVPLQFLDAGTSAWTTNGSTPVFTWYVPVLHFRGSGRQCTAVQLSREHP